MATREDALERLNNIKQQRQQNIQERYNNIIKNRDIYIEQQKQLQEQQRQLQEQQKLKDEQRRIEEEKANKISAISKNNTNSKGFNNSRLQNNSLDTSKFNTNIKSEIYNADNLAKKLNISVEDAQRHINNQKQKDENDVLKKLSKNIKNSPVGNSYGGNTLIDAIDGFNALGNGDALNIVENVESGITTGVANTISYLSKLDKKVTDKLDSLGTTGKVLAGLTGNLGYAFSKKEDREREYNDTNNWITGIKEFENKKVQKNIESTNSKLTKKVAELSPSMGNNLAGAGLSAINPIAGTAYFVTSASGSYYDDAISRGMNEDQALLYGGVMGIMEGLTEKIAVGDATKAGWLLGKGKMSQFLTKTGISLGENFVQEAIMEPLQETSSLLIGGKNTADFSNMNERMLKAGIDGALSAILMEGATAGVSSAQTVQNKVINNQEVTTQELQQCMKDIQQSGKVDVEKILKQEVKYQTQKAKSTYYDYYTGKKADNSTQNILNEAENIIKRNNMPNLEQNNVKNQNNNQQQQINQIQNKNVLNSNIEGQNNYINSAQKYNIDTNNQSVRKIGELANKRGINIAYDDSLFKNNTSANAIYQTTTDKNGNVTRNIILNPNANTNRTLEQIELHEIVHDMYGTEQFNKIKDMVLEYDKGKDGYQEARAGLEELYSQVYDKNSSEFQSLVDEEAVADILGNKLGDQQFVNELVTMKESRSIARKIYDWVVEKLNNMTRKFENMNSYFYWKDVKNKFEEAFRQEYQGNNSDAQNTRYFIETVASFDEIEYNRMKQIKLPSQEYAILSGIVNSDSNIKPGLNYVETTNATYEVYFKETGEFKVTGKYISGGQNDNSSRRNLSRTNETGNVRSWEQINSEQVSNGRTGTRNDEVLNINKGQKSNTNRSRNGVNENSSNVKYSMQESENNSGSFNLSKNHKQQQLDIIEKYNPMYDDYHTGIRNLNDIKTLEETLQDSDWARFDEFNPDLTRKDIDKAIQTGKITIYSSYPIEQGTFVSPSRMEAESYSGDGKVYSKEVNIEDVAWIDPTQGQYAKVDNIRYTTTQYSMQESENNSGSFNLPKTDNKGNMLSKGQQEYFKDSKVRDEDGNLLTVYHGTNNNFTIFDKSLSDEDNVLGQGLYFTSDNKQSLKYGEKQYKVYLNIRNPLIIEDVTTQALANRIKSIDNSADIMDYDYGVASTEKMTNYLIKNGYDGIKAGDNVYVAFDSNQVKNIDNTNPTTNQDIRYSTNSNNTWQNRLDTLYKNENKGTRLQDIKLPTKENMQQNINSLQDNEAGYPITKEEAFKNVINDALTNKNPKGTILLGKVKNNVAIKIKNILGIDVNNRVHSLSKTDIRHMIAQHGNQQIENNKGQIAITQEDILRIPDIINNPDKLVKGTDNKNGKTVRYIKNYGDNISFVVEVVPEKSGRMNIKTMWKKPTALTNSQMTPDSTSKTTDSSISSTTNSIPQNEKNATKNSTNSMFELTNEQKEKIKQLKEQNRQYAENKKRMLNKQEAGKFIKGYAMQISAEIRKIVQGDLLINVEGGLTENELNKKIEHLRSNYVGKEVYVDGNKATIVSNAFGNIKVEFEDGTYQTVEKEQIKPVVDIDNLIKEQEQQYQEYLKEKSINHIPQNENNVNNNEMHQEKNTTTYTDTAVSGKIRKHYKSIIESNNTTQEAKAIAKELMGVDTYIPESNKLQLEQADRQISESGADIELNSLIARAKTGGNIKSVDIAVGERLIQYYSKVGDKVKLRDAIQATAMAGTTAGQTVQAMSLLNHQTPEGQLLWLQRSIEKMNNDLQKNRGKKAEQFTLTDDMIQKLLNSKNQEEMYKNLDEVYDELGQQVTKTTIQKIDAWRYFSMLANLRTHIRNIVGNTAMKYTQRLKNKVAGVIESSVSVFNKDIERTHTIVPASKEVRNFAKADIKNVADRLGLNENKYNPKSRLENSMKTFKHKTLENTIGKAFTINDNLLEAEDGWGLKAGYKNALAEYMTANKLKPDTITDAQLSKARNYAVEQAKQATFHQECKLASLINQLANKNKVAKYTVDAILPFKKTPINIAKAGIEYSPVGLAKSMVYDTVQLRKGNININQYIDNVSKGLTGTGIALVGYALASAGILKATGSDDDKKERYDENQGKQVYSIQIGDDTYSLDWIAPTGIPLFIGAEIYENMKSSNDIKSSKSTDENSNYNQAIKAGSNILNAMTNAMNPMAEMSMLSGLTSALSSYEQGSAEMISSIGTNAVKSYVNQFVPTALGQVAKTTDDYERSTTSTKSGVLPRAIDTTKNQIMNNVPGLRQMLPVKTDIWGNEIKQEENIIFRGLENAILPYTRKEISTDNVDKELSRLYTISGNSSVLPNSSLSKDLTFSGEKYRMTSEEYSKYKKTYGKKSHELLNNMIKSSTYSKLSDNEREKAINKLYEYVKEYAKVEYATNNDISYKTSKMYNTVNSIEKAKGNASSYFDFYARTSEIEGENANTRKIKILANADYNKKDKELIYTNSIGSEDNLYNNIMKNTGININEYLKYKTQKFESDKKDDGTIDGKTINGSQKQKVYKYVNNMKVNYNQRLLLLGTQYKLSTTERQQIANYIKGLNITNTEKIEMYKKMKGFKIYKNGRITY